MQPWTREDTRIWIRHLESRLDDIAEFLDRTLQWCEDHGITDERTIFVCSFLTCIWVSQVRGEPICYSELMEMLGHPEVPVEKELVYELDPIWANMEHEELLRGAVNNFEDN